MEFEFEREAMKGAPLPKNLDIADSCAYMALKHLYAMYKKGLISRDEATKEKQTLILNWGKDKTQLSFMIAKNKMLQSETQKTLDQYCTNPSVENADKMYAAIYGLGGNWRKNEGAEM